MKDHFPTLRRLAFLLAFTIGGFLVGWSTAEGGLENYYMSAVVGGCAGFVAGVVIGVALEFRHRR